MKFARYLTYHEKAHHLRELELLRANGSVQVRDGIERGMVDADAMPLVDEINALAPGLCTVQSCEGHSTIRDGIRYAEPAHLWIRMGRDVALRIYEAIPALVSRTDLIETAAIRWPYDGSEILEVVFYGNDRGSGSLGRAHRLIVDWLSSAIALESNR